MTFWVWFALVLFVLMVTLLVSYLRLETFVSEREQNFRLSWLGHRIAFEVQKREVSWWFFAWQILRKPLKALQAKPKEENQEEKKPREKMSPKALLEERQRIRTLWRYFKHSLQVERFELNARLATPDPLWTGMLYGMVSSIVYPLKAAWPKVNVQLQPDFAHELPSGRLEAALGIRVFRLVILGLKAFPLVRKLRQHSQRKENVYGSSNPSQRNRRGYASSR